MMQNLMGKNTTNNIFYEAKGNNGSIIFEILTILHPVLDLAVGNGVRVIGVDQREECQASSACRQICVPAFLLKVAQFG